MIKKYSGGWFKVDKMARTFIILLVVISLGVFMPSGNAYAACTHQTPTVVLTPSSDTITVDSGTVVYNVAVTNNESGGCGAETYTLTAYDDNGTNFDASQLSSGSLNLTKGSTGNDTLTVYAKAGQTSGTNNTYVIATNANDPDGTSNTVVTTLSVAAPDAITTVTNGSNPTPGTQCPAVTNVQVNEFDLNETSNTASSTVSAVQVNLNNNANVSNLGITCGASTGTVGSPVTGNNNITLSPNLTVPQNSTVTCTIDMDVSAGATGTRTAVVNDFTVTDTKGSVTDSSATLTLLCPSTRVTDGTDTPANICPAVTSQEIDGFILEETNSAGSSVVSTITVNLDDNTNVSNLFVSCNGGSETGNVASPATGNNVVNIADVTVASGSTATCVIEVDVSAGATGTRTAYVSDIAVTYNKGTITDTGATLTVLCPNIDVTDDNGNDPASANFCPAVTNEAMDAFSLDETAGAGTTVTTITVTVPNSANVSNLDVVCGGDSGTVASPVNGDNVVNITDVTVNASSSVLCTIDMDVSAGALGTRTAFVNGVAVSAGAAGSVNDTGATLTSACPTTTVTDGTNPGNANICPAVTNEQINGFDLNETSNNTSSTVSAVQVNLNNNANVSNLGITCGASTGNVVSPITGNNNITLSPNLTVPQNSTVNCTIDLDVSGGASGSRTATVNAFTVTGTDGGVTDTSSTLTVACPSTRVTDGSDPAGGTVCPPLTNEQVDAFVLEETVGSGSSTVSAVQVTFNDTTDVSQVRVVCGGSSGTAASPTSPQSVTLSPNVTVSASGTQNCTIDLNVAVSATGTRTATITDITVTDNKGTITDTSATLTLSCETCDKSVSSCSDCHAYPPLDSPDTNRYFSNGAVVGDHQKASHSIACTNCHGSNVASYQFNHRNAAMNMASAGNLNGGSYSKGDTWSHTATPTLTGQCSNTNCHGIASPLWGTGTAYCDTCHKARTGVGGESLAAKHPLHYNSAPIATDRTATVLTNSTAYIFNCGICHDVDPTSQHLDGSNNGAPGNGYRVDIIFNAAWSASGATYTNGTGATASGDSGFTYWSNGTCSGVYCHSNAQSPAPTYATPSWDSAALTCTSCHGTQTASPVSMGGSHDEHVATDNYALKCDECHAATVGNDTIEPVTDKTAHVNGIKNVVFSSILRTSSVDLSGASYTGGQCSDLYCHSNAQSSPTYSPRTWGGAALTCTSCHGGPAVQGSVTMSGKHPRHVGTDVTAIKCDECHADTIGNDTNSPTISKTTHLNGVKNIKFSTTVRTTAIDQSSATFDGSNVCNNLYCHSNAQDNGGASGWTSTTPDWDLTVSCGDCHAYPPTTGSHPDHTSTYLCADCHNGGGYTQMSNHVDGLLQIVINSSYGGGTYSQGSVSPGSGGYGQCSSTMCHGTASPTWGAGLVNNCSRCHGSYSASPLQNQIAPPEDTAGDTLSSDAQVGAHQAHLDNVSGYSMKIGCPECHTVPATVQTAGHIDSLLPAELTFPSGNATADSYSASYSTGTCDVYCHNQTDAGDGAPTWSNNTYLSGSPGLNPGDDCTMCHGGPPPSIGSHSGINNLNQCNGCHSHIDTSGNITDKTKHINGIVDVAGGCDACHKASTGTGGEELAGKHPLHYNSTTIPSNRNAISKSTATEYVYNCGTCHNVDPTNKHNQGSNNGAFADDGYKVNIIFNSLWSAGGAAYDNGTGATASGDSGFTYWSNGNCSGVYCHSNAQSPPTYETTYWDGGSKLCTSCHGGPDVQGSVLMSGKHPRHVGTDVTAIKCDECHANTVGNDTNSPITDKSYHVNGTKNIKFSSTVRTTAIDQSAAGFNGSNQCTNLYCHSNAQNDGGTTGWTSTTPDWDLTVVCGDCHAYPPTTGSHPDHTGTYLCADCHNGGGYTQMSNHVDGLLQIVINSSYGGGTYSQGSVSPGSGGYGQCSSTMCHGTASPTWGAGLVNNCSRCHGSYSASPAENEIAPPEDTAGDTLATDAQVGAHQAHLDNVSGYSMKIGCPECHPVPANVQTAGHIDSLLPAEVTFPSGNATAQSYTADYTGGTCDVYCHNQADAGDGAPEWNQNTYLTGTPSLSGDCTKCHDAPPLSVAPHTGSMTSFADCNGCHPHVNASTGAIDDKTKHINGVNDSNVDCLACHAGTMGPRRAIVAEFDLMSHHGGSSITAAGSTLTVEHCYVCHAEALDRAGAQHSTLHQDGVVNLRDVDSSGYYSTWINASVADATACNEYSDFCMGCHDGNGATATYVTAGSGSPTNPFNETTNIRTNSYDQAQKNFTATGGGLNVLADAATGTDSNHAIRGARYTGTSLRTASLLSSTVARCDGTTGVSDNDRLSCRDCHDSQAHGSNNEYMLQTTTELSPTGEHLVSTYVCYKCHVNGTYDGGGSHTTNGNDFKHTSTSTGAARASTGSSGHLSGMACLNCHDSTVGWGAIHGTPDGTYVAGGGSHGTYNKRRFLPGSGLAKYIPGSSTSTNPSTTDADWEDTPGSSANSCYTQGAGSTMSGCTNHATSNGKSKGDRNVQRNVDY